ncbi:hypothetical protein [Urbifossiella limnaea]|uniref:HEAT repeat domain-containing protein n=1 Tax=Urbifossiella limnaea TaxID=2528023 RepID=A0A517XZ25_9BACT|nr:hypothetical protein [Urbifossiella limnaea]QDU22766.1 hypothetical protein ETAA1_47520 [Urbifossiella limnaea]
MRGTRAAALALLLIAAEPAAACTFCDGGFRGRQTLRLHHAGAKAVLAGQLRNPRVDANAPGGGTTEFHVTVVLKDDPARGGRAVLTLPKYLPVIGDTPPDYLIYCDVVNGTLDPTFGLSAPAAVVEYARAAAAATDADPAKQLGFFFRRLDHAQPVVAADAFLEFAKAADADILKAAPAFDRAKLRTLIAAPATPTERLGVFAFLLGSCGAADDAAFLAALLTANPPAERTSAAFGGLLAGYILLKPQDGWAFAATVLADERRGYGDRLSAVNTVRFFQATRPAESKPNVLRCCAALLPCGDLADQAVEDLRRWGYWELTADVLAQFPKPTHAAPIVRRAIVRYALTCPNDDARRFVAALRQSDPRLVADVEEMLRRFDRVPVPKN